MEPYGIWVHKRSSRWKSIFLFFWKSLIHFSTQYQGEKLCWCHIYIAYHMSQKTVNKKYYGQGMKVLWRSIQWCVTGKGNVILFITKLYGLNFLAKSLKELVVIYQITIYASKNIFCVLEHKLFNLPVTEIEKSFLFLVPFYSIIFVCSLLSMWPLIWLSFQ